MQSASVAARKTQRRDSGGRRIQLLYVRATGDGAIASSLVGDSRLVTLQLLPLELPVFA